MVGHYAADLADDESGHFEGTYGPLQSQHGRLVNIGDLVHLMTMGQAGVPLRPAAGKLLKRLEERQDVPLFVTQPGDYAREVRPDWLKGGRGAALGKVRSHWEQVLFERKHLYPLAGRGQVAILRKDAAALFPELGISEEESDSASAPPGQPARQAIQPEGGQWPHVAGTAWTDAEREAAFTMRHVHGWTGKQLAALIGVDRARIDEEIGPAGAPAKGKPLTEDALAGLKWTGAVAFARKLGLKFHSSAMLRVAAVATAGR